MLLSSLFSIYPPSPCSVFSNLQFCLVYLTRAVRPGYAPSSSTCPPSTSSLPQSTSLDPPILRTLITIVLFWKPGDVGLGFDGSPIMTRHLRYPIFLIMLLGYVSAPLPLSFHSLSAKFRSCTVDKYKQFVWRRIIRCHASLQALSASNLTLTFDGSWMQTRDPHDLSH